MFAWRAPSGLTLMLAAVSLDASHTVSAAIYVPEQRGVS